MGLYELQSNIRTLLSIIDTVKEAETDILNQVQNVRCESHSLIMLVHNLKNCVTEIDNSTQNLNAILTPVTKFLPKYLADFVDCMRVQVSDNVRTLSDYEDLKVRIDNELYLFYLSEILHIDDYVPIPPHNIELVRQVSTVLQWHINTLDSTIHITTKSLDKLLIGG